MYLEANLRVWILLGLSEGRVGMIFRRQEKASFRDWFRCRSRKVAMRRLRVEVDSLLLAMHSLCIVILSEILTRTKLFTAAQVISATFFHRPVTTEREGSDLILHV